MDIGQVRRDMAAIDAGRWVDSKELPELRDVRIKAKGLGSSEARDAVAKMQRDGVDGNLAVQRVTNTVCFMEIEGLTKAGESVTADGIRDQLEDPAMEPLALLILQAVALVDKTREAKAKAQSKN